MSLFKPSHVFANLPDTSSEMNKMNAFANDENKITEAKIDNRVIQVSSVGIVTLPPDRCKLSIRITSTKESVADVKESTTRRLDYIIQTLHNHSVKVTTYKNHHIVAFCPTLSYFTYLTRFRFVDTPISWFRRLIVVFFVKFQTISTYHAKELVAEL